MRYSCCSQCNSSFNYLFLLLLYVKYCFSIANHRLFQQRDLCIVWLFQQRGLQAATMVVMVLAWGIAVVASVIAHLIIFSCYCCMWNTISTSQITDYFSNGICVLFECFSNAVFKQQRYINCSLQTVLATICFWLMAKYESNVKLHVKQIKHIANRRNVIYLWKNGLRW